MKWKAFLKQSVRKLRNMISLDKFVESVFSTEDDSVKIPMKMWSVEDDRLKGVVPNHVAQGDMVYFRGEKIIRTSKITNLFCDHDGNYAKTESGTVYKLVGLSREDLIEESNNEL